MRSRIFNEISLLLSPRKVKRKMGRAFKWKLNDAAGIIVQRCRRTGKMWAGSQKQQKLSNRLQVVVKPFKHLTDKGSFVKGAFSFSKTLGDSATEPAQSLAPRLSCPWLAWPRPLRTPAARSRPFHLPLPGNQAALRRLLGT